jgi:hypothetical protein
MKTLKGRDLILVEDIIDTGTTMSKLIPVLQSFEPKSVRVAALLEKRTAKSCGFKADYVGFSIPDAFVVGASRAGRVGAWGVVAFASSSRLPSLTQHNQPLLSTRPPLPRRLQPGLQRGVP